MELNPYLSFDGQCQEAFRFYELALGARITFMTAYEGSPMAGQVPFEWQKKILHATLQVGENVLQAADAAPGNYEAPKGFSVSLSVNDPAEAERVFSALAENGAVRMPLQQTFWAARFGMLVDRFGIPWMINSG